MNFNEKQLEAINTIDGTVQVIASAGAGKTACLIERINHMISLGIPESEILAISFTNMSATELKAKVNKHGYRYVTIGTFHAICKMILEENGYDNLFNSPSEYRFKREVEVFTGDKDINTAEILQWIGYQKNFMIFPNESCEYKLKDSLYSETKLDTYYRIYEHYKNTYHLMDFDDWLIETHKLYQKNPDIRKWKYVLIDETQDSSVIQYELIKDFCSTDNIFVIGDQKQALYEFRSAVPKLFKNYYKNNPNTKVINLNTNYRSCKNIVDVSNAFIRPYEIGYKYYVDSVAANKQDGIIKLTQYKSKENEALHVALKIRQLIDDGEKPSDISVIYRNNSTADTLETALKEMDIPYYTYSNKSFFDRGEIKGIVAILRLVYSTSDDEAFENLLSSRFYPVTYYKSDLIDFIKMDSGKHNCSLYEAFVDHKFRNKWEGKYRDICLDAISRIRYQTDKLVPLSQVIDNIIKMFKVREHIINKYEYTTVQDKLDSLDNLKSLSVEHTLSSFINLCSKSAPKKQRKDDSVSLMTIHKSKGLEFKIVFLIGLDEEKFPCPSADRNSESRLMYVAITRPKSQLYVSSINDSPFFQEFFDALNQYKIYEGDDRIEFLSEKDIYALLSMPSTSTRLS